MPTYDPNRDITEAFINTVADWISRSGEVLLVLRYLRAGGQKDYSLCCSVEDLHRIIQLVPTGTDIVAFRNKQLPLRGIASPSFDQNAIGGIPDGAEFLLVEVERKSAADPRIRGELGDNHRDLQESLGLIEGSRVAVGICPRFFEGDNSDMISASKGGIDGAR